MNTGDTTQVPILLIDDQHPLTLARILDYCLAGERTGHLIPAPYIRALISSWARLAGTAREALLTATPDALGDLIRDWSGWCEDCRQVLAAWQPFQTSDHGLTFCDSCAETDRRANPSQWATYLRDRYEVGA